MNTVQKEPLLAMPGPRRTARHPIFLMNESMTTEPGILYLGEGGLLQFCYNPEYFPLPAGITTLLHYVYGYTKHYHKPWPDI